MELCVLTRYITYTRVPLPPPPPPLQLARSPDQAIVLQALGGLLNMTVSEAMREEVGKKGAVKIAIG